jgi:hypothetical protein
MPPIVAQQNLKYTKSSCILSVLMKAACLLVLLMSLPMVGDAQNQPEYDEITVFLNIQKVGGADVSALMIDETVYLPVVDIFQFLKIKNTPSAQLDSVSGFFISQQATYLIDRKNNRITFQGKVYDLKSGDMVKTETNLYLKSTIFGQIFGLDCKFDFRSLSVMLTTKVELPIIREMRQEQMRANINRLTGETKADTTIGRNYPVFHFGMADWSVISTQILGGKTDARLNLDLGTVIAGGEANIRLNYNNNSRFSEKQQQYLWRFVNNDRPIMRQVMAGKISTQLTASVYDPIVGVQFTNTPTTYRRSFGSYTLSDITEPNWLVELYVNNVLVDYMKADATGFFKFEVPLVYGNSAVKLKFYGLWGEERVREENISIPFNFLPPKELEYTVSAGIVEDTVRSRFSRASMNYGVSRRLRVGGGVEYLSSVKTGNAMPFLSTSLRLFSGLLVTGEYTYGVRAKGMLSYRLPSNLQFELNYTKYDKGQMAISYNYLEERKATVSIPIKGKNFAAYSRFTFNQIVLPNLKNTNVEMLWSGSVYGVNTNFTTYGMFTDLSKPYIYSNLSLAFKLPARIALTPQAQYEYNNNQLVSIKANLEKPLFKKGFLNMSFEQNFRSNTRSIEFGFRYDLSFAQTGFSVRNSSDQNTLVEQARGSLLYDRKTRYLGTSNRSGVGKGVITILPFLDVNNNKRHDRGEPKVAGLQFKINGGTIVRNDKDTTIRVLDLTPYTSYLLELDKNSFDNIAWQIQNMTMSVMIDPNQFKTIEVPIAVMGEASGTVFNGSKGQGRILVCFYNKNNVLVGRTLTEADGYYSYLGLKPGKYTVRIDPEQLKRINMVSSPEVMPANFSKSVDGDIVEGLDFLLAPNEENMPDTVKNTSLVEPLPEIPVQKTSTENKLPDVPVQKTSTENKLPDVPVQKTSTEIRSPERSDSKTSFIGYQGDVLQIAAFKNKENAFATCKRIGEITGKPTIVVYGDVYYFVQISGIATRELADQLTPKLAESGFRATYIPVNKINAAIQFGEYEKEEDALNARKNLIESTRKSVTIIFENGHYKVQIKGFESQKAASDFASEMGK